MARRRAVLAAPAGDHRGRAHPRRDPARFRDVATLSDRPLFADLAADARQALASGPARAFLVLEIAAASYQLLRRGPDILPSLAILAGGGLLFGLAAWLAGRHPSAHPEPDPVRAPIRELVAVGVIFAGIVSWFFGAGVVGYPLVISGLACWALVALLARYRPHDFGWVARTWQPYLPLILALALPKLLLIGSDVVPRTLAGLTSGIIQQLLLQVGLNARLEAFSRRGDVAAVLAALGFGIVHVPLDLPQAGGDWGLAFANAIVLQAVVGLVSCLAYQRHRAPLGLGFCHALLMA